MPKGFINFNGVMLNADHYEGFKLKDFKAEQAHTGLSGEELEQAFAIINPPAEKPKPEGTKPEGSKP
jgi:hypothetical protein